MHFNSSWALFAAHAGDDELSYSYLGKNQSFDNGVEKRILSSLRIWSVDYLKEHSVAHVSNYTPLEKVHSVKDKKEMDLLAVVVTIFDRDDLYYELTLKDFAN